MSEDDRAAKAARAKAMLKKKRQQKKGAGGGVSLASPPPSRSNTPAIAGEPSVTQEDGKPEHGAYDRPSEYMLEPGAHRRGSLSGAHVQESKPDALPSSPRLSAASSPPPAYKRASFSTSVPQSSSSFATPPVEDMQLNLAEQANTSGALRTDKEALHALQVKLEDVQSDVQKKEKLLEEEQSRCRSLETEVSRAGELTAGVARELEELSKERDQLQSLQKAGAAETERLTVKCKELEAKSGDTQNRIQALESGFQKVTSELRASTQHTDRLKDHVAKVEEDLSKARNHIDELVKTAAADSLRWQEQDQNRQQTISLLVSEKASFSSSLQRLEDVEKELQEKDGLFRAAQAKSRNLTEKVHDLELTSAQTSGELRQSRQQQKELSERCRDQERAIQLRKAELSEFQAASEQYQQRIRELEEQIENDDRADRLEVSLKNTQDRADELEFQLSKHKQTLSSLKAEKDEVESQLRSKTASETEWRDKCSVLGQEHSVLQEDMKAAHDRQSELEEERASLESEVQFNQSVVKGLQQKLGELAAELSSRDKSLTNVQGELRASVRRAEESERTQRDLQAEGIRLTQALEETRTKIVELTATKAELLEKVEKLEYEKRSCDTVISKLEIALHEGTEREAEAAKLKRELELSWAKDKASLQQTSAELQRGYDALEAELKDSQTAVHAFEAEQTKMRQAEMRQADLSNRLASESRRRQEQFAHLESNLLTQQTVTEEQRNLIMQYTSEIEALRNELMVKEEELENFQKTPVMDDAPLSLDNEMLSALKQQHALELSSAQSQIRSLETAVFEAQDRAHRLQRQVAFSEDQLTQMRTSRTTPRPFSPATSVRSSSRASPTLRRGSSSGYKQSGGGGALVPSSTRTVFDVGLSPETKHKRQISLAMLKARIESETTAVQGRSPRMLSPVPPVPEWTSVGPAHETVALVPHHQDHLRLHHHHHHHRGRPQFMDESHIFWCHSCRGDLLIL